VSHECYNGVRSGKISQFFAPSERVNNNNKNNKKKMPNEIKENSVVQLISCMCRRHVKNNASVNRPRCVVFDISETGSYNNAIFLCKEEAMCRERMVFFIYYQLMLCVAKGYQWGMNLNPHRSSKNVKKRSRQTGCVVCVVFQNWIRPCSVMNWYDRI